MSDGSYQLPVLDSSLYSNDSPNLMDESDEMQGLLEEAATRPSKKRKNGKHATPTETAAI